ncbi:N-6 DNA methylase [Candidatus Chloroploca sp. Khr17]|uniref:Eco57I restriction-modification methylase domain-containing protein n=1 Tax=Candidatus Chloroploca sp. Khr17 TaxID=2496869 RepID=UPI00101D9B97|nr:N-6 DNA methylase [Candidatus Chloroploca sp. Khr17]
MPRGSRDSFMTVRSEGGLLPADLLRRIGDGDASLGGLTPATYHLVEGERINEAINYAWSRLLGLWAGFRGAVTRLAPTEAATGLTRERWLLPLFQELGYGRLQAAKAVEVNGKSYALSHAWGHAPIHLVGCRVELDRRSPGIAGAARGSPHSLVQEVLNASSAHLWGFVANGLRLRLLRDNVRLTRQAYVEFDLEAMFEGQVYADFVLLWLVCHQSRVEAAQPELCWLERWSRTAQAQGTRALEQLRDGVERAITALGCGFLAHQANGALRERLRSGLLSPQDYYRQVLRLVYRLLFLFVAEERDLLLDPQASPEARVRYQRYYALATVRQLAERRVGTGHTDLYQRVRLVMHLLGSDEGAPALGLPALGGFLFSRAALPELDQAELSNHALLDAIRALAFKSDRHGRRLIDYKNLGSEELGSVYESLLDLHPTVNVDAPDFTLATAGGSERKTSGSYYTPTSLITCLLDSALDPVLDQAVRQAHPVQALLDLKIIDPACGSGHFLIAAAHRLARRLAALRTGDEEPAPEALRTALREVIGRCIYGVDSNAMAVELCKVSLWLEALEPGKPLTFLDHHIRVGNSLVGATRDLVAQGLPDEAYKPLAGDDKAVATMIRKRNKQEREAQQRGQLSLGLEFDDPANTYAQLARSAHVLNTMPDDNLAAVRSKAQRYEELRAGAYSDMVRSNLWTAAFFTPLQAANEPAIPTSVMLEEWDNIFYVPATKNAFEIAQQVGFFHWELEFPDVFARPTSVRAQRAAPRPSADTEPPFGSGGFDVVLGNPPWERIKLQEQEHFVDVEEIRNAPNKAARERLMAAWRKGEAHQRTRMAQFDQAKYRAEAESRFVRGSGRFALTAVGDVNTYALFAELARDLLAPTGRAGIIVPTGIATDDSTKAFFGDIVTAQSLVSFISFENEARIFAEVHHAFKFAAVTMSGSGARIKQARFVFFCRHFEHVTDPVRNFTLSTEDFLLINPNTRTAPVFRTNQDAELTKKIYRTAPVLINEQTGANPWGVRFLAMFHMSNDSHLFQSAPGDGLVPLYEAKMFWHFDHRYGTYEGVSQAQLNQGTLPQPEEAWKANADHVGTPRYWIPADAVKERLAGRWDHGWLLGFRDVTSNVVERTAIFSLLPRVGVGNNAPLILFTEPQATLIACFLATVNALVFDFATRPKVGGTHMNFFIVNQLPVLPPSAFSPADIAYIVPRVVELVYTAWDIKAFAEDVWEEVKRKKEKGKSDEERAWAEGLLRELVYRNVACNRDAPRDMFPMPQGISADGSVDFSLLPATFCLPPYRWNDERRAQARAELDAHIARLYGLTRDDLRYILDPADVYGADFPGETFRVLKEKELKLYGEYRTGRLVLAAWDREEEARARGQPKVD